MIFLASSLDMNGGTTFLLRTAKEYNRRGRRCAVIVMTERVDSVLRAELELYADVFPIRCYLSDRGAFCRSLLSAFAPLRLSALSKALEPYGSHFHAMGLFPLILGLRLTQNSSRRLTAGVYHQNEFLYRPPPFYFAREGQRIFSALPAANVIFYNESSRENYAEFFHRDDFRESSLLPIGISLDQPPLPRKTVDTRIVSIGNLLGYKTYNRHMIGVVASLKNQFPGIRYDIYGTGPIAEELQELAQTYGVADRVKLHGTLPYEQFRNVVANCDLFVGSGTSLIEAAAVGRPAMIGIESIDEPETYGFLCDARGFSYNEDNAEAAKVSMESLARNIFANENCWSNIAMACQKKSLSFSVEATADGLDNAGATALPTFQRLSRWQLFRLASSAVAMAVIEKLGPGQTFHHRRDQSFERSQTARTSGPAT